MTLKILIAATLVAGSSAACERDALLATVDQYLTALEMGWAGALENVQENFTNRENNRAVDITAGVMFNGLTQINHNRTTVDIPACATFSEIIATDYTLTTHYVIGTQMRHVPEDMSLYSVDSIVSTNGSRLFNATQTLTYVKQEDWSVLPEGSRSSRTFLKAAADAYLIMLTNGSEAATVPWGAPCDQLDGSLYGVCTKQTLTPDTDDSSRQQQEAPTATSPAPISDRRYVIDEAVGSVNVFSAIHQWGGAADSHEFRLENGSLRYIHSITATKATKLSTDPGRGTGGNRGGGGVDFAQR